MGVMGGQWIRFSGYAWATVQTCAKGDISLSECVRVVPRQALSDISDPYCPVRRAVGRVVAPRPKPMLVSGIQIPPDQARRPVLQAATRRTRSSNGWSRGTASASAWGMSWQNCSISIAMSATGADGMSVSMCASRCQVGIQAWSKRLRNEPMNS